jgi:hypothetical protein
MRECVCVCVCERERERERESERVSSVGDQSSRLDMKQSANHSTSHFNGAIIIL